MGYQALLFCPDEKLARVISQVFSEVEFTVEPVAEPFAAVKKLMSQHYDAVVVDCENEQNTALLFRSARNSSVNHSALAIAVVEGQAGVAKAYRIGANLVLTKPVNVEQAKGTLRVARGLLRKGADASATAGGAATHAPAKQAAMPSAPVVQKAVEAAPPMTPAPPAPVPELDKPLPVMAASAPVEVKPQSAPVPVAHAPTVGTHAAQTALDALEQVRSEPKHDASKVVSATHSVPGTSLSAAAAPAPAKAAVVPPHSEVLPSAAQEEVQKAASVEPVYAAPVLEQNHTAQSDAPSFGAVGEEPSESTGSKKILLILVAILALAAAGYFGWTKFNQTRSDPAHRPDLAPRQNAAPSDYRPTSAPASSPAATPAAPGRAAGKPEPLSTEPARIALDSEPQVPKPSPIAVKPQRAIAVRSQAEDTSVAPPPSPLALAGPTDADLPNLVSTTGTSKPVLARVRVSQGVSQGLVIKRVAPKYPQSALAAHIQGVVEIEATVTREGFVINPKVLSGDRVLAAAAIDAVKQWRYKPYYLNGEPVEIQTQISINFKAN